MKISSQQDLTQFSGSKLGRRIAIATAAITLPLLAACSSVSNTEQRGTRIMSSWGKTSQGLDEKCSEQSKVDQHYADCINLVGQAQHQAEVLEELSQASDTTPVFKDTYTRVATEIGTKVATVKGLMGIR